MRLMRSRFLQIVRFLISAHGYGYLRFTRSLSWECWLSPGHKVLWSVVFVFIYSWRAFLLETVIGMPFGLQNLLKLRDENGSLE
jgi:hypothetical protein